MHTPTFGGDEAGASRVGVVGNHDAPVRILDPLLPRTLPQPQDERGLAPRHVGQEAALRSRAREALCRLSMRGVDDTKAPSVWRCAAPLLFRGYGASLASPPLALHAHAHAHARTRARARRPAPPAPCRMLWCRQRHSTWRTAGWPAWPPQPPPPRPVQPLEALPARTRWAGVA